MEPLKKCQVEGLLMEVEPSKLFGNLDELCDVSYVHLFALYYCFLYHSFTLTTNQPKKLG